MKEKLSSFKGKKRKQTLRTTFPTVSGPNCLILTTQDNDPREGRPRIHRPEVGEAVLQRLYENPRVSSRGVGNTENVSHQAVLRIAHEDNLRPFHLQKVHKLHPGDPPLREDWSNFLINQYDNDDDSLSRLLMTDEATFTRGGKVNVHNNHVWAHNNPHASFVHGHQQRFSINVWAGMIGNYLIGPYILPPRLNGQTYLRFLQEVLPGLLEEVPLEVQNRMWFQHDGAPPHNAREVREHLDMTYPGRWIGRGGPVRWPPRCCDYSVMDFFFWGATSDLVCDGTEIKSEEELVARIAAAAGHIRDNADIEFPRVWDSLLKRCHICLKESGGNLEQFL